MLARLEDAVTLVATSGHDVDSDDLSTFRPWPRRQNVNRINSNIIRLSDGKLTAILVVRDWITHSWMSITAKDNANGESEKMRFHREHATNVVLSMYLITNGSSRESKTGKKE